MALITAAEAKLHLPIVAEASTAEDTHIETVVARVGRVFARWCGYPPASVGGNPTMESTSYTLYLDGPGGQSLRLPVWPVTAITSIYDDPDRSYSAAYLVASTDYELDGEQGLVILKPSAVHGAWSCAPRAVKATVTAGFPTVPDDVKLAACLMFRHIWNLRAHQGRANVVQGEQNASLREETMPAPVKELLAPFRLPSVWL